MSGVNVIMEIDRTATSRRTRNGSRKEIKEKVNQKTNKYRYQKDQTLSFKYNYFTKKEDCV